MVAAAPNRTALVARVERRVPHATVSRWDVLTLLVQSSEPVEGYHDVIRARPGQRLEVAVDREWLPVDPDLTGATVRLAATMAGPGVLKVAHADPPVVVEPG